MLSFVQKKTLTGTIAITLAQAFNKLFTFSGQLILAWFLVPSDFTLIALAASFSTIGLMLTSSGVRDILIQKQELFDTYKESANTLSLLINSVTAFIFIVISPIFGLLYNEPNIVPLIIVTSVSWMLNGIITPYAAAQSIKLDFKTMAILHTIEGIIFTSSSMLLAINNFGAMSVVLPLLWKNISTYIYLRHSIGYIAFKKVSKSTVKLFLGGSILLIILALVQAFQSNAVNYAAGINGSKIGIGLYYWAYSISSQAIFLFALNLKQVFFPSFCALNNKLDELLKSSIYWLKKLLLIIIPICILQILLSEYIVKQLFPPIWWKAIPAIKYLSVSQMFIPFDVIGSSILLALGRFRLLILVRLFSFIMLFIVSLIGIQNDNSSELALHTFPVLSISSLSLGLIAILVIKNNLKFK